LGTLHLLRRNANLLGRGFRLGQYIRCVPAGSCRPPRSLVDLVATRPVSKFREQRIAKIPGNSARIQGPSTSVHPVLSCGLSLSRLCAWVVRFWVWPGWRSILGVSANSPTCASRRVGEPTGMRRRQDFADIPGWTLLLIFWGLTPFLIAVGFARRKITVDLPASVETLRRIRTVDVGAIAALVVAVGLLITALVTEMPLWKSIPKGGSTDALPTTSFREAVPCHWEKSARGHGCSPGGAPRANNDQ
jgi:hypothetical protein